MYILPDSSDSNPGPFYDLTLVGECQIIKSGVRVREVLDYNVHDGEFFPMKSYSVWFYLTVIWNVGLFDSGSLSECLFLHDNRRVRKKFNMCIYIYRDNGN